MHQKAPHADICATHRDAMHLNSAYVTVTAPLAAYSMIMSYRFWPEGNDCRTATADRQAMQSYLDGPKESQQECNGICFHMATPSCVFMLHNGWKQSCRTQQCTACHDVLKKLPAPAKRGLTTVQFKSHTPWTL